VRGGFHNPRNPGEGTPGNHKNQKQAQADEGNQIDGAARREDFPAPGLGNLPASEFQTIKTMGTHYIRDNDDRVVATVTYPNIYRFNGFTFEVHHFCGPAKLKKDFSVAELTGRKFWKAFSEWEKLTDAEKAETQIAS
jgi:hypothetical protein